MDTLFQFYFAVGLVWAMYWTLQLTTMGVQKLALRSRSVGELRSLK